jgi:zinc D-Ala-D-Ala carboxypeptidase
VSASKYFTEAETEGLDPRLLALLDRARGLAKVPFWITSGKRSAAANDAAGGVKDSAHIRGLAVDIRCADPRVRMRIVSAAIAAGFTRIGVYTAHLHLDADPSLPADVMWVGESH